MGNRTQQLQQQLTNQPVVVTSYSYDAGNQITSIAYASGARTTYLYDQAGNLHTTQAQAVGGSLQLTTYTWDYGNRLVAAQTPSNGTLTNTYDASGLRQAFQSAGTGRVTQTYDAMTMNLLRQDSAKGQTNGSAETDRFLYTPDTFGSPIAQLSLTSGNSVTQTYAYSDLTHNVAVTATGAGSFSSLALYAGFGLPVPGATSSLTSPTPLSYGGEAGYFYDPVTGLYNAKHRWIDPVTGRFISVDPSGFGGGDWANLYRYVENNPVIGIDPNGLLPCRLEEIRLAEEYCESIDQNYVGCEVRWDIVIWRTPTKRYHWRPINPICAATPSWQKCSNVKIWALQSSVDLLCHDTKSA